MDPKQLAAELQKVSQQQTPGMAGTGVGPGGLGVLSALERSALLHSGTGSAASSGVPSPGQPASPAINKKQRHKVVALTHLRHTMKNSIFNVMTNRKNRNTNSEQLVHMPEVQVPEVDILCKI